MAITWKYSLLSDNYASKFIRRSLQTDLYYRTKQLSGPSTSFTWEKKIDQNKPTEENKVSRWQKETPLDLDINLMGRTINSVTLKWSSKKPFYNKNYFWKPQWLGKSFLFLTLSARSVTHNHIFWTKKKEIQVISQNFTWQEPVWHKT